MHRDFMLFQEKIMFAQVPYVMYDVVVMFVCLFVCLFRSICRHFLTSSHYILATSTNTFNCWNMYSDFFVLIDNWYMVDGN
jgi:hypothetical protein